MTEATQATAGDAPAQTGQADPPATPAVAPKEDGAPEEVPEAKPSDEVGQGTEGDETTPAKEKPATGPETTVEEVPDDLSSVVLEREEAKTPPTRTEKVSSNKWDTARHGDGDVDPNMILEFAKDPLLMKTAEVKAKEWGYGSAKDMIDDARANVASATTPDPDTTPEPTAPVAGQLDPEDVEFVQSQRKEAGQQVLKDEQKDYDVWEEGALEGLEKNYEVSQADFKANHQTEFRKLRNEAIREGTNSVEAGKAAMNQIKVSITEGTTATLDDGGNEMPESPSTGGSPTTGGEKTMPLVTREKYFDLDMDGKVSYLKQHSEKGSPIYA